MKTSPLRHPVVLPPDGGRHYPMGRIHATFKADGEATSGQYAISEWWLEPNTKGPGAHTHPEDDVFYVLDGTMSILIEETWMDAEKGAFVLIPGGVSHDFENRGKVRAGVLNFSVPGHFEKNMPAIQDWFLLNPPEDAISHD